jgi:hypothetical protein
MADDPKMPQPKDDEVKPQRGSGLPADFYQKLAETGSLSEAMGGTGEPKPKR